MLWSMVPLIASWLPIWKAYIVYFLAGGIIMLSGYFIHSLFRS